MDEAEDMLSDCEDRAQRLSAWESDFIQSLREQVDNGRRLSPRQLEVLEQTWERVTARG